MHDRLSLKGVCLGSCDFIKFWQLSENISKNYKTETVTIE